jgi:hypothetical protein
MGQRADLSMMSRAKAKRPLTSPKEQKTIEPPANPVRFKVFLASVETGATARSALLILTSAGF